MLGQEAHSRSENVFVTITIFSAFEWAYANVDCGNEVEFDKVIWFWYFEKKCALCPGSCLITRDMQSCDSIFGSCILQLLISWMFKKN